MPHSTHHQGSCLITQSHPWPSNVCFLLLTFHVGPKFLDPSRQNVGLHDFTCGFEHRLQSLETNHLLRYGDMYPSRANRFTTTESVILWSTLTVSVYNTHTSHRRQIPGILLSELELRTVSRGHPPFPLRVKVSLMKRKTSLSLLRYQTRMQAQYLPLVVGTVTPIVLWLSFISILK